MRGENERLKRGNKRAVFFGDAVYLRGALFPLTWHLSFLFFTYAGAYSYIFMQDKRGGEGIMQASKRLGAK